MSSTDNYRDLLSYDGVLLGALVRHSYLLYADEAGDSRRITNNARDVLSRSSFRYEKEIALQQIEWLCRHAVSSSKARHETQELIAAVVVQNGAPSRTYSERFTRRGYYGSKCV